MKIWHRCAYMSMAAAVFLSACGSSSAAQGKVSNPVNIAVLSGFTGSHASVATSLLNGTKVAQYLIENNGGIAGSKIQLIPEDDGFDPIDAVTVTRKVIGVDNASAIVGLTGLDYQNALPIIERSKVIDFNTIGDPSVDHTTNQYIYSVGVSDALSGAAMTVAANLKGYKRIALVFDATLGSQGLVPAIKTAAAKLGMTIVADPSVPETSPSYQDVVQQVVQSHPDAVLMQVQPAQVGGFFRDWKNGGGTPLPIIASNLALASPEWGASAGADESQQHITAVASISNVDGPGGKLFASTWQQLFNGPYGFFGAYGYDAVTTAALAMEAAHSSDASVYQPFVDQVTDPSSGHTSCTSYSECVQLLRAGHKIKFIGVATPLVFNKYHRVSADNGVYTLPLTASQTPTLLTTIPATQISAVS